MFQTTYIAGNTLRHQFLGRQGSVRENIAEQFYKLGIVHFGNHFPDADLTRIKAEDHIVLIKAGQRNKTICMSDPVFLQNSSVCTICAMNRGILQHLRQCLTALGIVLNDGNLHAGTLQQSGEMDSASAAAQKNDVFDRFFIRTDGDEKAPQRAGQPGHRDSVTFSQDIIAAGDLYRAVAFHTADQYLLSEHGAQFAKRDFRQPAVFFNSEGNDLHLAFREGFHSDCRRELKDTGNLLSCHEIRMNGEGQLHRLF